MILRLVLRAADNSNMLCFCLELQVRWIIHMRSFKFKSYFLEFSDHSETSARSLVLRLLLANVPTQEKEMDKMGLTLAKQLHLDTSDPAAALDGRIMFRANRAPVCWSRYTAGLRKDDVTLWNMHWLLISKCWALTGFSRWLRVEMNHGGSLPIANIFQLISLADSQYMHLFFPPNGKEDKLSPTA